MILEYLEPWRNRVIDNPLYRKGNGRRKKIKVGSLPPEEQEKYRPSDFDIKSLDKTTNPKVNYNKEIQKDMEEKGYVSYTADWYILVPNKYNSVMEYVEDKNVIPAVSVGYKVPEFRKDEYVIKIKNIDVASVVAYMDENNKFVSIKDKTPKEKNQFIKENSDLYEVYALELKDYIHADGVVVINDSETPLKIEESFHTLLSIVDGVDKYFH